MPALQAPKKISRRQELRQDAVVTATARAMNIFEEHRTVVVGAAVALVVAILGFVGYQFYQVSQSQEAAAHLGAIVLTYEQGRYEEALDGTAENLGLIAIANRYGSTPDGNLARYYAGDALYRLNRKEEALEYFEAYDKSDDYLGSSAYAAEAAIQEDLGNAERAAALYHRAALTYENNLTSPDFLLAAARNYESIQEYGAAADMYNLIKTRFPDADAAGGLDFYLARLDALRGNL